MTSTFSSSSRLANFRERKKSGEISENFNNNGEAKLTLPPDDKITYEPSNSLSTTKTSLKLFKSKLERVMSREKESREREDGQPLKQEFRSSATVDTEPGTNNRISLHEEKSNMKLVLNDSPVKNDTKSLHESEKKPQKRIMILRNEPKQQPQKQQIAEEQQKERQSAPQTQQNQQIQKQQNVKQEQKQEQKAVSAIMPVRQEAKQYKNPHDQKPIIKEEDIEESKDGIQVENQNDLVICTEGCGRKFNRKALEKHVKACKLVFMSKRKQFNSEAKRITSKEQTNIAKQKQKQKNQLNKTKSKGFDKTSDNWKAASEDFRAAIKAVKKQENCDNETNTKNEENHENKENQNQNEKTLNLICCQYCEKMFANVLIEKHVENCTKKKQKQRQQEKKKSGALKKKI